MNFIFMTQNYSTGTISQHLINDLTYLEAVEDVLNRFPNEYIVGVKRLNRDKGESSKLSSFSDWTDLE